MFNLQDYDFEILNNANCYAFSSDEKPLNKEQIDEILEFIFVKFEDKDGRKARWKISNIANSITLNGRFTFDSYRKTFAFVSAIYLLGLEQHYYPDIMFGDGFCYITLFTIKLKGIHRNDLIMLAKIENMIGKINIQKANDNNEENKSA
jgi:4a-hydroxytetrahydrobiopterin dehydratase